MARQFWTESLNWVLADGTAIANSNTETIIFSDLTIPANYMQTDRALRLTAFGRYSTTATPTLRFRLRWGGVAGTQLWDSGTITLPTVTAATWKIELIIQTRTGGSAGSIFTMGDAVLGSAAAPTVGSATGAPGWGVFGSAGDDTPAAVGSLNLTADTALSLTALWSAASASNTLTGHIYVVESLN